MIFSQNKTLGTPCETSQAKGRVNCPYCGQQANKVLAKTLKHLLRPEIKAKISSFDSFYYCKTPTCKSIYFRNAEVLRQEEMSIVVGLKEGAVPVTLCYCFEWTKEKIQIELKERNKTIALEDIKAKMQELGCFCEILNPSGACCLADVAKAIQEIQREILC